MYVSQSVCLLPNAKTDPEGPRRTQKDPEEPRRTQKDPEEPRRTSAQRQTFQEAFAHSRFSSWFLQKIVLLPSRTVKIWNSSFHWLWHDIKWENWRVNILCTDLREMQANWHFLYPLSFVGTWIVYLRWMEQRTSWRNVGSPSLFPTLYLPSPTTCADCRLELQKKVREHFKFTQKATTRAFSWLKVPTSAFTMPAVQLNDLIVS